jgi:isoleucyl-tRNA synthetase
MAEDKGPSQPPSRSEREERVLQFWKDNQIFDKTLRKEAPQGDFVFYEGPPTANGRPAVHHLEARAFKDAIPRYKTMRGFRVPRKAGWDTHGLPVELEVEKTLGFKSKKDIEEYGIAEFNKKCKESVGKYIDEWTRFTDRIGYWVNLDEAYYTYQNSYIEAVWKIVKHVDERGLLYKDYKVLPWCPRCGTALSSHELAQGYKDVKDLSLYVKFRVTGWNELFESSGRSAQPDVEKSIPTYLLAWTTTPWTLPGNLALAVGEKIDYVKIKKEGECFILAEARLSILEGEYEVVEKFKGTDLVGLSYEPLYNFVTPNENTYKVYIADFVTTEDGTGIVHTAVMYGQEDFELGSKVGLPKAHLVAPDGTFMKGTDWLEGRSVVDETLAVDILKDIQSRGLLFAKENHLHSYPFCWRCKTRLIYYARDSWYIRMSALRNDLMTENEKINWEPDYIKEGRFGEWLREVKDWAVSRERYWATPLPVWVNEEGERLIVDSVETLKKHTKTRKNEFIFVRHGEAESNANNKVNSDPSLPVHLTEKGREEAEKAADKISKIDVMYVSPYLRTKETAQIIAKAKGFDEGKIQEDERLVELNFGDLDGKPYTEFLEYEEKFISSYDTKLPNGESYNDAKRRFGNFLYEINARHEGQHIVVVTHGMGLESATALMEGANMARSKEILDTMISAGTGAVLKFDFTPLPHNENYELDLHRPYIDEVVLEKNGKEFKRVKEVMDVWFDSGSMPFAQDPEHVVFPADFISEAIDQTRGWFYTLHAIGVLMEKGLAFRNAICLGHLLDKDGKKMSKSVGNVLDPWQEIEKYGVDVLRFWMYSINQPGESKNYDDRTVKEVEKRVFNLVDNVYAFYELYRDKSLESEARPESGNVLDQWILIRLEGLSQEMGEHLDSYQLLEPARDLAAFVDDLSTWYLRRTRERIKSGEEEAKQTLYYALKTLAKLLAPFAPFAAEELYQKLRTESEPESVHLAAWPQGKNLSLSETQVLAGMKDVRRLTSLALEARSKAGLKIRQPLSKLTVRADLSEDFLEILGEELNVKEVILDNSMDVDVMLDIKLTPELIEEGEVREAIRNIQDLRKEAGLRPGDVMQYQIPEEYKKLFEKYGETIKKATNIEGR